MSKPTSSIWGENPNVKRLSHGIYIVTTMRHSGIALSKACLNAETNDLDFLKPLNKLDLTAYAVVDDPDFLYFEEHININVICSLMPVQLIQKIVCASSLEQATEIKSKMKNRLKNCLPIIYEQLFDELLAPENSTAIAEANFYFEHQDKLLIKANYAANSTDTVEVKTQYLSDGEIYGRPIAQTHTYLMSLEDFKSRVKDKIVKQNYPSNGQPQHLICKDAIEAISAFKKVS